MKFFHKLFENIETTVIVVIADDRISNRQNVTFVVLSCRGFSIIYNKYILLQEDTDI